MSPQTLRQWAGLEPLRALEAAKTALILIDFQVEYFDPAKLRLPDGPRAAANAARLLAAAGTAGLAVLHVRHVARNPAARLFAPGSPGTELVEPVRPRAGEVVVTKSLPSGFAGSELDAHLRAASVETLVLAGLMTHMAVDGTARDALTLGYRVLVAADACATRDLPDGAGGVISAADVQRTALAVLADRFADVLSTEAVLALLG